MNSTNKQFTSRRPSQLGHYTTPACELLHTPDRKRLEPDEQIYSLTHSATANRYINASELYKNNLLPQSLYKH